MAINAQSLKIVLERKQREAVLRLGREYHEALVLQIRPYSQTISSTLQISAAPYRVASGSYRMRISSPYFWAGILDQGRGRIEAGSRLLVWFADPRNDPRIAAGYPRTVGQIRRLSDSEYQFGLEMNRLHRRLGLSAYMIVREVSGPFPGFQFTIDAVKTVSREQRRYLTKPVLDYAAALFRSVFPSTKVKV